jgi:hypothetical protein
MKPDDPRLAIIQQELGLKAISPVVAVASLVLAKRSDEAICSFLRGDITTISAIAGKVRQLIHADQHGRKVRKTGSKYEIPADWKPEENDIAVARRFGLSSDSINVEAQRFVAYWLERKEKRPGWSATWRTWVQRKAEREGLAIPEEFRAIGPEAERDWPAIMRRFEQDGVWSRDYGPRPGERGCKVPRELLVRKAAG